MVNKVILIGNVGLDPEVRTTEGGVKVARVRLATTERLFDRASNETKEHTEWHTITLWRGLADVVDRFVRKGSQIYIEGRLRTREWMDKDNNKRYTTEILADTMNLLGRRSDNPASDGAPAPSYGAQPQGASYGQQGGYQQQTPRPAAAPQPQPAAPSVPADDPDDLPFRFSIYKRLFPHIPRTGRMECTSSTTHPLRFSRCAKLTRLKSKIAGIIRKIRSRRVLWLMVWSATGSATA